MQSNASGPIGLKHLQLRLDQRGGFPILVEDGSFWLTAQPDALAIVIQGCFSQLYNTGRWKKAHRRGMLSRPSSLARSNGRPSSAHDDRPHAVLAFSALSAATLRAALP
jgi:hypothetical protein